MYDYLLVGAGLFNAVLADMLTKKNKKCLVLEKRNHIGGNCYTYEQDGIIVHKYGAHIFRTSEKYVWEYVNNFAEFNHFINSPIAVYGNEVYNLPFNMNTFSKMWGIKTPQEAKRIISEQSRKINNKPTNLEEHSIKLVGTDIYEKLIKGYTEKQWGKPCRELPISIMKRIPVRYTYDNNYYNDKYQGIPIGGYTPIIEKMLSRSDVILNEDFNSNREQWKSKAKFTIYTGNIDGYFDYCLGELEYRSLKFETNTLDMDNYQGVAVVNYTEKEVPYTRIIEHKHFEFGKQMKTVITKEYPIRWERKAEPYYPINTYENTQLYEKYCFRAKDENNVIFAGRLGGYRYTDMQDTVRNAMNLEKCLH